MNMFAAGETITDYILSHHITDFLPYPRFAIKGELRAKFHPNFFFIYRFVYAYYNVVQNFIIFGKGFRKL